MDDGDAELTPDGFFPLPRNPALDPALLFGGFGLFVEGLRILLIVALVLLVLSAFTGYRGRTRI